MKNIPVRDIGLSLALTGVPIGTFAAQVVGFNLVYPLMILSVILFADYRYIFNGQKKRNMLTKHRAMLYMLTLMMAYALFSVDYQSPLWKIFVIQVYSFVFCILMCLQRKTYKWSRFLQILFYISSVGVLMATYIRTNGFSSISITGDAAYNLLSKIGRTEEASAAFLFGEIALMNLAALLCYKPKSKIEKIIVVIIPFVDFYITITSMKRTVVVVFFMYVLYWLWEKQFFSKSTQLIKSIKYFFLFLPLLYVLTSLPVVKEYTDIFVERTSLGAQIIMGDNKNIYEESASARIYSRERFYIIEENGNIFENIIGHGWMTDYLDCPIFQIYLDLGLLGLLCFLYCFVYKVLFYVRVYRHKKKPNFLFGCMISLYPLICIYHAGLPYSQVYLLPIMTMMLFSGNDA